MSTFFDYLNSREGGQQQLGRLAQQQAVLERIRQNMARVGPYLERYAGVEAQLTGMLEDGQLERVEALLREAPSSLQAVDRLMEAVRLAEMLDPSRDVGREAFYAYCQNEMSLEDIPEAGRRQTAVLERIRQANEEELARRERQVKARARQALIRQERARLGRIPEMIFFQGVREECIEDITRRGVDAARGKVDTVLPSLRTLKGALEGLRSRNDLTADQKRQVESHWSYCISGMRSTGIRDATNECARLNRIVTDYRNRIQQERSQLMENPFVRPYAAVCSELVGRVERGEFDGSGWSLSAILNQLHELHKWQDFWARVTPATAEILRQKADNDNFCQERMVVGEIEGATMRYANLYISHLSAIVQGDRTLARFAGVKRTLVNMIRDNKCAKADKALKRIRQPLSELTRLLDSASAQASSQGSSFTSQIASHRQFCETKMTENEINNAIMKTQRLLADLSDEIRNIERKAEKAEEARKNRNRIIVYVVIGLVVLGAVIYGISYLFIYVLDTWWKIAIFIVGSIIVVGELINEIFG